MSARSRDPRDGGFTLAELAVTTAVLSIILLAVGALMFGTTITQRSVTAVSEATSSAQSVADEIRTRLRNALEAPRISTADGTDQILIARVASTDGVASSSCIGWYYAADERQLRRSTWTETDTTPLPGNAAAVATWPLLLDGVQPRSGSTEIFAAGPAGTIAVAFEVEADDRNSPTAVEFSAATPGAQGGSNACWD